MTNWIAVEVSEGLFPNERIVQLNTVEGEISFFVSPGLLDENMSRLRVELLDEDSQFALVQVPSQGGIRVAKVVKQELIVAP